MATEETPAETPAEDAPAEDAPAEEAPAEEAPGPTGDPALDDPESLAKAVEGTTSDPTTRAEGTSVGDTPSDPTVGLAKPSDAPDYPFPPGGDVEVALVKPGSGEGEYPPAWTAEDWVVLDGSHPDVPDRLDGKIAGVIEARNIPVPGGDGSPNQALTADPEANVLVRVRDDPSNALLSLPPEAFKRVAKGGRTELLPVG